MQIADEISWRNYLADVVWNSLPVDSGKVKHQDQINFRCPICGDSKRNRSKKRGFYYISTKSYHCFNCGANMMAIPFLRKIAPDGVLYDVMKTYDGFKLASIGSKRVFTNGEESKELVPCTIVPAWGLLVESGNYESPTALTQEASDYLDSRMVGNKDCFLSITDKKGRQFILILYKYLGDCIFYQLHNYTEIFGIPKYLFPNSEELGGQEKPPFGIDSIDPSWKYIICCEGVYDALSYANGVALSGRVVTAYQKTLLAKRWPAHKIVMAFDNDLAGKTSMKKLAAENPRDLLFLDIGDVFSKFGKKDANDFAKLGESAAGLLKNRKFLESRIKSALEMNVQFQLG